MKFPFRRDLGLQLLALYLLFVGPVVLASLSFDRIVSRRLENDVKSNDLALARAIAQETNTAMDHSLEAVKSLSSYPEVLLPNQVGMEKLFATVMSARPDINLVYRLDARGIMIFHYPTGPGSTVNTDFSFRDYFQRAKQTHEPLLSKGRISPTTEQPVTTAVMPLWDENNQFLGLVATNIKLESLSETLTSIVKELRPNESFEIDIIDSSAHVIAHPNAENLLTDLNASLPQVSSSVLAGESGNLIDNNTAQQETLYSYVPIPSVGWGVIVSRPTEMAFATPRAIHRGALVSTMVFLIIGLLYWVALSRQVIRPLEKLAVFSQTIGLDESISNHQQHALSVLSERPDQIGHLIRSLRRMEEAIEARLNELSTLLQTSAAVVSSLEPQTVLNSILEQVERLMDIHMCAIVALDENNGVFRAQASRGLSRRYVEHIAISPSEPMSTTMRAIHSGRPIQVSDTENDPTFVPMRPRARSEGYRSLLAVPLNTQHAPPSVLLVYRQEPHVYTEREINLLTSFANHAAMAIENAALYARSDLRLREQTRRLEALIQSLQDGLVLENPQGRVLYANRRISDLVELPLPEIIDEHVERLFERLLNRIGEPPSGNVDQIRQQLINALEGNGPRSLEIEFMAARNQRFWRILFFDVTDSDGTPIGRGQILRDITQNREIDRMKSSLISTVSHELRTPLASIKGYATTLLAEDVEWDSVTQHEFLEIISSETDRLSKLITDLLDISRIEAGNLKVNRVECQLGELINRAARRAYPYHDGRLQIDLPPDLPSIYVDAQRIESVLGNLIENAAKYAGDQSPINISASLQSGKVIVRVKDEGPGIPPEYSKHVFDSFYRVEDGLTRPAPGAGLGLAICQGFVNAHGGEIWIEPQPKGLCIAFSIPLVQALEGTKSTTF